MILIFSSPWRSLDEFDRVRANLCKFCIFLFKYFPAQLLKRVKTAKVDFDRDFLPHCAADYKRRDFSKDLGKTIIWNSNPWEFLWLSHPNCCKTNIIDYLMQFYFKLWAFCGNLHIVKIKIWTHLPDPDFELIQPLIYVW